MDLVFQDDVVDEVLGAFSEALGPARGAYRGHVYRVFNCARWLLGTDREDATLAVASSFHDLGIWSDATFDYLAPSMARASEYLSARATTESPSSIDPQTVARVIGEHHRLRRVRGPDPAAIVEAFRLADRVDVSRGWLSAGVPRSLLRELVTAFPYDGFHGTLLGIACRWFLRNPWRPLPMLRF